MLLESPKLLAQTRRLDYYPTHNYYKCSIDRVYEECPSIRFIFDCINSYQLLTKTKKYVYVDVKTHILKEGECPGLQNWHVDVTNHPLHEEVPHNLLWISNGPFTQFLADSYYIEDKYLPQLNKKNQYNWDALISQLSYDYGWRFQNIQENAIYSYTNAFHRPTYWLLPGITVRTLVRVTETNIYLPSTIKEIKWKN